METKYLFNFPEALLADYYAKLEIINNRYKRALEYIDMPDGFLDMFEEDIEITRTKFRDMPAFELIDFFPIFDLEEDDDTSLEVESGFDVVSDRQNVPVIPSLLGSVDPLWDGFVRHFEALAVSYFRRVQLQYWVSCGSTLLPCSLLQGAPSAIYSKVRRPSLPSSWSCRFEFYRFGKFRGRIRFVGYAVFDPGSRYKGRLHGRIFSGRMFGSLDVIDPSDFRISRSSSFSEGENDAGASLCHI